MDYFFIYLFMHLKSSVSEKGLFYFKLLLSVNVLPLFIYKNFLKLRVSESRDRGMDSLSGYKGMYGSFALYCQPWQPI